MAVDVRGFADIRLSDDEDFGGKGANLGELTAARLPVPPGFVAPRQAYTESMIAGGVAEALAAAHREALTDPADELRLGKRCQRMAELVSKAGMTPQVRDALLAAYHALGANRRGGAVLSHRRGRPGRVLRRHERQLHQRLRR